MSPLVFVIKGNPVSQKNRRDIVWVKGRPLSVAEPEVKAWQEGAYYQLVSQANRLGVRGLGGKGRCLETTVTAYQGKGQHLDGDNIAAAPLDALQKARIVTNDYWCIPLHVYRNSDEKAPRVEVLLSPWRGPRITNSTMEETR